VGNTIVKSIFKMNLGELNNRVKIDVIQLLNLDQMPKLYTN